MDVVFMDGSVYTFAKNGKRGRSDESLIVFVTHRSSGKRWRAVWHVCICIYVMLRAHDRLRIRAAC